MTFLSMPLHFEGGLSFGFTSTLVLSSPSPVEVTAVFGTSTYYSASVGPPAYFVVSDKFDLSNSESILSYFSSWSEGISI